MNRLERAILEHRAAIRSIDRAALGNVLNTYEEIMARLNPQIEVLVQTLRTKGELTPSELFRLDRYQELQRQIAEEMRTLATATGDITAQAQTRAIQEAVTSAENMAVSAARGTSATATVATSWVNVPTKAVEDFIGASRSGPLAELLASFEDVTGRELVNQITNALATGTNPRAVADAIVKSTEIGRNRALTIARTEMMRSSRSATLAQYEENADILQGWIWSCAKSDNTCGACLAMDGTTHPQGETMDSHVNCRCSPIPWLKDIPMRKVETGEEWLAKQTPEAQDAILGKAGGAAYRAGEVKLDDFVKITNSPDWGKSIGDGGIGFARMNAGARKTVVADKPVKVRTLNSVKEVEELANKMPLYARWQTQDKVLPKFSTNHATGMREPGLSVNGLSGKSPDTMARNIVEYQHISGDKLLFVTGDEIALGSDLEPIIINARVVARGSKKLIDEAANYTEVMRCAELIARGDIAMARFFGCPGV